MPTPQAERDIARAAELRKTAKTISDKGAAREFNDAADRLERRAGKSAHQLARKSKRKPTLQA